jgi:hypothetical protein
MFERHLTAPALPAARGALDFIELEGLRDEEYAIESLNEELARRFRVSVRRDIGYLTHRYELDPARTFRSFGLFRGNALLGLAVTSLKRTSAENEGRIYELLGLDDELAAGELVAGVTAALAEEGASVARCWYRGFDSYARALRLAGYHDSDTEHFRPACRYFAAGEERERAVVEDPSSWFLTLGDTDL